MTGVRTWLIAGGVGAAVLLALWLWTGWGELVWLSTYAALCG